MLWRRQETLGKPHIDQGLHGLDFLVPQQPKELTDIYEMDEARVELLVRIHVPERLEPVAMVDVCVAPHHLAVDALDVGLEGFGKARSLADPFTAGELRERGVQTRGAKGLRGAR